jgi:alpha-1,6-mannosyltransferase
VGLRLGTLGRTVKVSPERKVHALGAILLAALTVCSRNFGDRGGPYFMASLTLAGIAYLLAVREFFVTPIFPRRVVIAGLVLAAVWHIEFLRLPAGADDDIHRYVWDGRLQRLGYNPYVVVPSDPAFAKLHTDETRTLNNPDLPSPYPPGAQLFFRAATANHESTFALKVAFVLCDFAIALVLLDLLRNTGRSAHLVLAYAWNPLLAIEVAGSGHIDIVGALLLVISVAALARRWRAITALTFGLAVAVKFLPIVLLPLYWKRIRIRDAALAAAVVALLYAPFLNHGRIPFGSLGAYVTGFRFNGPVFAILHQLAPPQLLVALAVLVGLGAATFFRTRKNLTAENTLRLRSGQPPSHGGETTEVSPPCNSVPAVVQVFEFDSSSFAWPMAATLLFAPAVFPWYLLWLLPFLTSASIWLIIIWTVSVIPVYVQWHLRTLGRPWGALPGWIMVAEYGCIAAAAAIITLRRITQTSYKFPKRS